MWISGPFGELLDQLEKRLLCSRETRRSRRRDLNIQHPRTLGDTVPSVQGLPKLPRLVRDEFTFNAYIAFIANNCIPETGLHLDHFVPVSIGPQGNGEYTDSIYACATRKEAKRVSAFQIRER